MPQLNIIEDGDGCWPDLANAGSRLTWVNNVDIDMAMLKKGTVSGMPSVAIRINLPDGRIVVAETTLRLLVMAAHIFAVKADINPDGQSRKENI